jgi:ATP-dependent RNA helicase HelY
VLVSAPTSSGKTVVADYVIWRRLDAPAALRRPMTDAADVVYTTPLKALSNQKYHDLCERFGEHRIGLITGEHTLNDGAPVLVMTTEMRASTGSGMSCWTRCTTSTTTRVARCGRS